MKFKYLQPYLDKKVARHIPFNQADYILRSRRANAYKDLRKGMFESPYKSSSQVGTFDYKMFSPMRSDRKKEKIKYLTDDSFDSAREEGRCAGIVSKWGELMFKRTDEKTKQLKLSLSGESSPQHIYIRNRFIDRELTGSVSGKMFHAKSEIGRVSLSSYEFTNNVLSYKSDTFFLVNSDITGGNHEFAFYKKDKTIHFFDPNFGEVIFSDAEAFRTWWNQEVSEGILNKLSYRVARSVNCYIEMPSLQNISPSRLQKFAADITRAEPLAEVADVRYRSVIRSANETFLFSHHHPLEKKTIIKQLAVHNTGLKKEINTLIKSLCPSRLYDEWKKHVDSAYKMPLNLEEFLTDKLKMINKKYPVESGYPKLLKLISSYEASRRVLAMLPHLAEVEEDTFDSEKSIKP